MEEVTNTVPKSGATTHEWIMGFVNGFLDVGESLGTAAINGHYGLLQSQANNAYQNSAGGGTFVINTGSRNNENPNNNPTNNQYQTNKSPMPTWGWVALVVVLIGFIVGVILWKRNKG